LLHLHQLITPPLPASHMTANAGTKRLLYAYTSHQQNWFNSARQLKTGRLACGLTMTLPSKLLEPDERTA
jgi:hypothetical protein